MSRLATKCLLIGSVIPLSWLLMMAVHEGGHCLFAVLTGGTVTNVVLHPIAISRTDIQPNPAPLLVCWGGPVVGSLFPFACWLASHWLKLSIRFVLRFIAGFCLLANGLYLGIGSLEGIGDAGELLRLGMPISALWLFGIVTTMVGISFWHNCGAGFDLGPAGQPVPPFIAIGSCTLLLLIIGIECMFSGIQ